MADSCACVAMVLICASCQGAVSTAGRTYTRRHGWSVKLTAGTAFQRMETISCGDGKAMGAVTSIGNQSCGAMPGRPKTTKRRFWSTPPDAFEARTQTFIWQGWTGL